MNINQLECFVVAAQLENFTEASKRLHVSQAAITQQMKALEAEVGADLFSRKGRRVRLTQAGAVYLSEVREVLKMLGDAGEKVRKASEGYTGQVSIGFIKGSEQMGIASAVAEFHRRNPGVAFRFRRGDYTQLFDNLIDGTCDIVLNDESVAPLPNNITSMPYCTARIMAFMSMAHPCALRESVAGSDFTNDIVIKLVTSSESKQRYDAGLALSGLTAQSVVKAPDAESLALMAACGMGVGFLPEYDLNLIKSMPSVSAVPVEGRSIDLYVYWNKDSSNDAALHFQRFLAATRITRTESKKLR